MIIAGYNKKNLIVRLMFFIIWPFATWLYSFFKPGSKASLVVFYLFSLLLLWHMAPAGLSNDYHDFLGILLRFQEFNSSTLDLKQEIHDFVTFSSDAPKEIYEEILMVFVYSFTNNYHFYFLIATIPVAFFQVGSLRYLIESPKFKQNLPCLMVMVLMIIPRDIIGMQNPRFTTGFWLSVFCLLYYFQNERKYWALLPILITPFIHSGFWILIAFLLLYFLFPSNYVSLEKIVLCTIPFAFFDMGLFNNLDISFLPDFLSSWAKDYMNEEKYKEIISHSGASGFFWVEQIIVWCQKACYMLMTVQIIKSYKYKKFLNYDENIYHFYLMLFGFVNMIQFVPELGLRYYGFLKIFCVFIWFQTCYPQEKRTLFFLFFWSLYYMIQRYGYFLGGALSVNMPPDIFYSSLPQLIYKGLTTY